MPYNNGMQNAPAAAKLPWLVKFGIVPATNRQLIDDAKPNNWREYADNAAGTGRIHYLIGVDPNNQTYLNNPNGSRAFAFQLTQLATPATPTITNVGTAGVTTQSYKVVAKSGFGSTLGATAASAAGSTTTGNATLSTTNYNVVTWAAVTGAASYDIYRTVGGAAQGKIASVLATVDLGTGIQTATYTLNDTALVADGTTAPTANTTGALSVPAVLGDFSLIPLTTPVGGAVTVVGTAGAATVTYKVVAKSSLGTTAASSAITTTTANATQSSTNYNTITWNPVPGALSYDIYRTAGGATQGKIANVLSTATLSLNDTGLAGDSATAPTVNSTGQIRLGVTSNFIATETGSNNAIAGALTDESGGNVPLTTGLRVTVALAHTLQAGANTFAFNGGSAASIKSHNNAATDIGTAYAATGYIDLVYNGTVWLDMSQ